jgi:hypothetical protein
MAEAELKVHADRPEGIVIFRSAQRRLPGIPGEADAATIAKPGNPEWVALLVRSGDHLGKQFDVQGQA